MQLHYNILWVDNDIDDYIKTGDVKSIADYLVELGFVPNIVTINDEDKIDGVLFDYKYDLIISDFNLNKTTGDVIIKGIREEKGFSTEILFYSANTNFRNNPDVKNRLAFLDRITFHNGRDTLMEKIERVIELTLDKLLELNATRGLITSATSELDFTIEELTNILVDKLGKTKEELDGIVKFYIEDFLVKSPDRFLNKYEENGFNNQFPEIEANRKWGIFRELVKELNNKEPNDILSSFLKINRPYFSEIISTRNKFAHAKAEEIDGKVVLKGQFGKEGFEFDEDSCVEIRKNIVKHKDNFEILESHLSK